MELAPCHHVVCYIPSSHFFSIVNILFPLASALKIASKSFDKNIALVCIAAHVQLQTCSIMLDYINWGNIVIEVRSLSMD